MEQNQNHDTSTRVFGMSFFLLEPYNGSMFWDVFKKIILTDHVPLKARAAQDEELLAFPAGSVAGDPSDRRNERNAETIARLGFTIGFILYTLLFMGFIGMWFI